LEPLDAPVVAWQAAWQGVGGSPGAVCECITCGKVTVVGIYVPIESIEEMVDEENVPVEDVNPEEK
jgi:hypothetical protein